MATVLPAAERRDAPSEPPRPPFRFNVEQYLRMHEEGVFGPAEHTELLAGVVYPLRCGKPYRYRLDQYERMIRLGLLGPDDRVELLEGDLVEKMTQNPPHRSVISRLQRSLGALLPPGRLLLIQAPLRLGIDAPEPDAAVLRGELEDFDARHPEAEDVALVVEVADATLREDRGRKQLIYARSGVPCYWIADVASRTVEVLAEPSGERAGEEPRYLRSVAYGPGDELPVLLDGAELGRLPVAELFPRVGPTDAPASPRD